ncbi:hypothetical protein A3Q56_00646 [Intoshia linei]|uniref:Peptidase C1A papain C-terminal domain-containing protein n=1 Tax=Intoshia linei TaxID=1819745 RepID=A0A177BBG3_9BILA|nr:hypothetical protein A3Q56_00646 [Intoshia linei]
MKRNDFLVDYRKGLYYEWSEEKNSNDEAMKVYYKLIEKIQNWINQSESSDPESFLSSESEMSYGDHVIRLTIIFYHLSVILTESGMYAEAYEYLCKMDKFINQISFNIESGLCKFFSICCAHFLAHVHKLRCQFQKAIQKKDLIIEMYKDYKECLKNNNVKNLITEAEINYILFEEPSKIANEYRNEKNKTCDPKNQMNISNFTELDMIELAYSNILEIAAYCYERTDQFDKSAEYCVKNLNYSWNNKNNNKTFNYYEWSLNCAQLSNFYSSNDNFSCTLECLCISRSILEKHKEIIIQSEFDEKYQTLNANIKKGFLVLLTNFMQYMCEFIPIDMKDECLFPSFKNDESIENFKNILPLAKIYKHLESNDKEEILIDIKMLFTSCVHLKTMIQKFYTMHDFCQYYIEVDQLMSKCYKFTALKFDPIHKCKFNQRRIQLYVDYVDVLNSQYFLNLKRELYYELGEILTDSTLAKFKIFQNCAQDDGFDSHDFDPEKLTKYQIILSNKINNYSVLCEEYFIKFIGISNVKEQNVNFETFERFQADEERLNLLAYFHIGIVTLKRIYFTMSEQIKKLKDAKIYYNFFVAYCDKFGDDSGDGPFYQVEKNTKQSRSLKNEYTSCKEGLEMLEIRIKRLYSKLLQRIVSSFPLKHFNEMISVKLLLIIGTLQYIQCFVYKDTWISNKHPSRPFFSYGISNKKYTFVTSGYISIPGAEIIQRFKEYHIGNDYSLVSFYDGLIQKLYYNGKSMSIVMGKDRKRCFKEGSVIIYTTVPNLKLFTLEKILSHPLYGNVEKFVYIKNEMGRNNTYTLYMKKLKSKDYLIKALEMQGRNILENSHYDFYQYVYTSFYKVDTLSMKIFDSVKKECENLLNESNHSRKGCRLHTPNHVFKSLYDSSTGNVHLTDISYNSLNPYLIRMCSREEIEEILNLEQFDWRSYDAVSPIKDQSICGSCWSFGTTGAMEGSYFLNQTQRIILSEQELVDCSWDKGNNGCHGGLENYACSYMKENGGLSTDIQYGRYIGVDAKCKNSNKAVKIVNCGYISQRNDTALKLALLKYGPITISIDASCDEFGLYTTGILNTTACKTSPSDLDHSVLLVGYGHENDIPFWILKNSWSTHWGANGYAKIAMGKNDIGITTSPFYFQVTKA